MNDQIQLLIEGLAETNYTYEGEIEQLTAQIKQLKEMIAKNNKKMKTLQAMLEV